jgi:hypothetical protein
MIRKLAIAIVSYFSLSDLLIGEEIDNVVVQVKLLQGDANIDDAKGRIPLVMRIENKSKIKRHVGGVHFAGKEIEGRKERLLLSQGDFFAYSDTLEVEFVDLNKKVIHSEKIPFPLLITLFPDQEVSAIFLVERPEFKGVFDLVFKYVPNQKRGEFGVTEEVRLGAPPATDENASDFSIPSVRIESR